MRIGKDLVAAAAAPLVLGIPDRPLLAADSPIDVDNASKLHLQEFSRA